MRLLLGEFWFNLLLITFYIIITGCNKNDMPFPRCISADYFGPEPITVSAHFPIGHSAFFPEGQIGEPIDPETGEINYGFHYNQVVKWKDTGLETSGDDLIVRVNGAWTPWGNGNKKESRENYNLQSLEQLKYKTKFETKTEGNYIFPDINFICNNYSSSIQNFSSSSNTSCTVNCKYIDENYGKSITSLSNYPCWFTNGNGAYFLFRRPNEGNPNESLMSMRNPKSPTIHLGYNSTTENGSGLFILKKGDKTKLKDINCETLELEKGWKIYVKILDKYYLNNIGGYSLEFLSGVQNSTSGFFDYVYNYLKCVLLINENCEKNFESNELAAAQAMFQNIAEKSMSFHNFVFSLLVIFIVVSSLLYLFGMIQETKHDIIIRIIKITLVIVIISPGSFNFFYNNFLILFVKGLERLINVVTNFSINSNNDQLFGFMEDMLNKFFTYSVWKKFTAFFHYKMWTSLLMVPIILIGIILYFLLCVYAYIIFLSGFVGIAFLIAVMPLFLICILFSSLKNLFEGWIKLCVSFCLQSVMIFVLLSFLASSIMSTFYRQLGFTVCYNKWLEVKLCAPEWIFGVDSIFSRKYFGWTPGQIFVPYVIGGYCANNIDKNIDDIGELSREGGTVKFTGGAGYIHLPPDYINKGFRYIDYPFFNPIPGTKNNPADHYISETDIVINTNCSEYEKNLVRLTNSLLHASEKSDILSLISIIDKNINDGGISGKITELYCRLDQDEEKCQNYREILNEYKNGKIRSDLKKEVKSLVEKIVESDKNCKLENFFELDNGYQNNNDYHRVQDIQVGHLIDIGEVFILFLLSFLIFSLREFVQQIGSSIAGGGYGVYNISSMYEGSTIISLPFKLAGHDIGLRNIAYGFKLQWQDAVGRRLEFLTSWVTNLPSRLADGTANLLERIPRVGGVLKYSIDTSRNLLDCTIEATKLSTSLENNVDKFEEKISNIIGIDKNEVSSHKIIGNYLDYYKGYVGSHLSYTMKDAMKFVIEHGFDPIGKHGYNHSLIYKSKLYRQEFLRKLYDDTIGRKKKVDKNKDVRKN